jgi:hypothetical protein
MYGNCPKMFVSLCKPMPYLLCDMQNCSNYFLGTFYSLRSSYQMKSKNDSNGFITIGPFVAVRKLSTKFRVSEHANALTDGLHKFVGMQPILQKYKGNHHRETSHFTHFVSFNPVTINIETNLIIFIFYVYIYAAVLFFPFSHSIYTVSTNPVCFQQIQCCSE